MKAKDNNWVGRCINALHRKCTIIAYRPQEFWHIVEEHETMSINDRENLFINGFIQGYLQSNSRFTINDIRKIYKETYNLEPNEEKL